MKAQHPMRFWPLPVAPVVTPSWAGWLFLFTLLLTSTPKLQAFSGKEGASFLDIPVGGAPAALGGAYTALAADSYAPVWNPAGLGFLPSTQIAGQHLAYLDTLHYEFLSGVHPLKKGGALGVSAQYLGSGDIRETDIHGDIIGSFNSHYAAYNVAYGQRLTRKLSLGVTGKLIDAKIGSESAHAFAADLGGFYRADDKLDLGIALTNVGTDLKFVDQPDPLPTAVRVGAAYWPRPNWTLSIDGAYRRYGLGSFHTAVEWRPLTIVSLRAGYRTDTLRELSWIAGVTTGFGIHLWGHEFDYAWLPMGDLGNTQYFSLVVRFWEIEVPNPKRNLIHYNPLGNVVYRPSAPGQSDEEAMALMELLNNEPKTVKRAKASEPREMMQILPTEQEQAHD